MPYISASIMMQLLTAVVPQLGKLARKTAGARRSCSTRATATIALCIFQGYLLAMSFENPQANPFLPGIMDTINRLGWTWFPNRVWASADDGHHPDRRDNVPDVAR